MEIIEVRDFLSVIINCSPIGNANGRANQQ